MLGLRRLRVGPTYWIGRYKFGGPTEGGEPFWARQGDSRAVFCRLVSSHSEADQPIVQNNFSSCFACLFSKFCESFKSFELLPSFPHSIDQAG